MTWYDSINVLADECADFILLDVIGCDGCNYAFSNSSERKAVLLLAELFLQFLYL